MSSPLIDEGMAALRDGDAAAARRAFELGFPYDLLRAPVEGQMVYGDLEPKIELPAAAPYRWK